MDFFDALRSYSNELYCHKKMKTDEANSLEALKMVLPVLEGLGEWSYDAIHDALIGLAEQNGLKNGRIMWPVRTALSGKAVTPRRGCGNLPYSRQGRDPAPHPQGDGTAGRLSGTTG